jgi:hypothetical protein
MNSCRLYLRVPVLVLSAALALLPPPGHASTADAGGSAPGLVARVEFTPHLIDRGHRPSPWVTILIEPLGFDPASIVQCSVRLAGAVPPAGKIATVADRDRNGMRELELKFSRRSLDRYLAPGLNELQVTGVLVTGEEFRGSGNVRVADPHSPPIWIALAPNPLNPTGTITLRIGTPGPARVALFDIRGRLVRSIADERWLAEGVHQFRVDGRDGGGRPLATGVYFYGVETADGTATGRVTILK